MTSSISWSWPVRCRQRRHGRCRTGSNDVRVTAAGSHTVIECSIRDQSALRALLTQLWDTGAEVLLVSHTPTDNPRSHHAQAHH